MLYHTGGAQGLRGGAGIEGGSTGVPCVLPALCHHLLNCPGPGLGRQEWPGRSCREPVRSVVAGGVGRGAEEEKRKKTLVATEEEKDKSDWSKYQQDRCVMMG